MENETDMKISFVIPTVGTRENLLALINTLKSFPEENSEILVVLQFSKRNNPQILKKLQNLKGINLIVNSGVKSSGSNRNIGASVATGQFLCFIDDDISLDHSFTSALKASTFDTNTIYFSEIKNKESVPFPLGDHVGGKSYVSACFIISRVAFRTCGPFNEYLNVYREDSEFFIRARKKGFDLKFMQNTYVWHPVRFTNFGTIRSFFTKNTYEPLFHKITQGEYKGVLQPHLLSTIPNKFGSSLAIYYVLIAVALLSSISILGHLVVALYLIILYFVVSILPTSVYILLPSFFYVGKKRYILPMVSIYMILFPEIFVARLVGSVRYRHFTI